MVERVAILNYINQYSTKCYMYIDVVDNAMTVAGIISFTMALDIILKISFRILSTDTRSGKDRC
jgi:hypothetical protein